MRRLPGRLNAEQAAAFIGVPLSAIPLLTASKLLKPLGQPAQNSMKIFASIEVEELCRDRRWLDRVTRCIEEYHRGKNKAAAKGNGPASEQPGIAA